MLDPILRPKHAAAVALSFAALALVPRAGAAATVSCNIPQPCALYTNAQGFGLSGTSAKSAGLEGITTFAATSSSNGTYGVAGLDSSTNKNKYNTGVYGYSPYGWGLRGVSPSGVGLYASSTSGTGINATSGTGTAINAVTTSGAAVVGASTTANGIYGKTYGTSSLHAGVTGVDLSTNAGINDGVLGMTASGGYGVEGRSTDGAYGGVSGEATNGTGVRGTSTSGPGVQATSVNSFGLLASGQTGVYASGTSYGSQNYSSSGYASIDTSSSGTGVYAQSVSGVGLRVHSSSSDAIDASTNGGIGAYVINTNGNASDFTGSYIGVVARSNSFPLLATDTTGANLFYVDGSGNVYSHGTFRTFVATRGGASSTAFTTRSTAPNVEDVGSAQLVNGVATVAFDAAFGASIDPHAVYHVFLTPNGDTRGLYVATKTPAGFVVRETQDGRGSLAFDYRIVAAAPGHAGERMALVGPKSFGAVEPKAAVVTRTSVTPVLVAPAAPSRKPNR